MNKNAIKKFAIAARTRLIDTVSDKAGTLGITKDGINEPSSKGNGFEIYMTSAGTEVMLQGSQMEQRRRLVAQVKARGFDVVMEEVAYTWFNRICAIRFMEVNDYLPMRIRVLSSLKEGKNEPDLLTEAPNVELDFSDKEREWIINAKAENRLDELFSMLFIKQCNKLSEVLPELFEATEDYTEMLLNLSYTNKDDVIRMLVDGVDEKDFNVTTPDENGNPTGQVEIIGWLYQYYNTELKDDTFAQLKKNVKISKERIPAATQLFTPDWIVRYMVENSVGRIWIEHLRAINPETNEKATAEKFGWKYYLPEAEQELEVNTKLTNIRKSYADIKPEDILCIDPCMGSGHIIVAMFDVLMDIYKSVGYGEREAAFEIVEHNLHGLDIDKRAYQLAYFAVMMKGRQYNRRFFRGKEEGQRPQPKVYAFIESNDVNRAQLKYFGAGLSDIEKNNAITQMNGLLDTFKDAREYGSILNVDRYDWELLRKFTAEISDEGQMTFDALGLPQTQDNIKKIIDVGELMARKYDALVTNPPYMGNNGMSVKLSEFVKRYYNDVKMDMFACCIEKFIRMISAKGIVSMVTMESWMFLSSYEYLRDELLSETMLPNLVHMPYLGKGGTSMGISFGTSAFSVRRPYCKGYKGRYTCVRYYETNDEGTPIEFPVQNERYAIKCADIFSDIPGSQIAYWASDALFSAFKNGTNILEFVDTFQGIITGDNDRFLRLWYEVEWDKIAIDYKKMSDVPISSKYWIPYNKGGDFKKWYGNQDYVVNWRNGPDDKTRGKKTFENYYLRQYMSWSYITSSTLACRYFPEGFLWDVHGSGIFDKSDMLFYLQGLIGSKVGMALLKMINSTISYQVENIAQIPVILDKSRKNEIDMLVKRNIEIAKEDWDFFEVSWNFTKHPLLRYGGGIEESFNDFSKHLIENANETKKNEREITDIFKEIYNITSNELEYVEDRDVTVHLPDIKECIITFVSYVVGCLFGRFSLDEDGLVYAGGEWDEDKYRTFIPDIDNIIPITDEEYFEDDIVGLFCGWIKKVFGADALEKNLDFIAKALGNKGDTSREVIRNYFLNDFFKDHCNAYSVTGSGKRPIYWLFDSGKQNGFKALIYMHRYSQDTVGRVRTDYLHKTQKAIEQAMQSAQYTLDNSNSGTEKSKATKRISKYTKQLAEIQLYDEAIAHIANQRIELDLDDGVKVNYEKFQGVEVSREGMKTVKIDLLSKI